MTSLRIKNKFLCYRYFLAFVFFTGLLPGLIAQTARVKLTDAKSSQPVSFATVLFTDLATKAEYFRVSDEKGLVVNPCRNRSVIRISCIGYTALTDTIPGGKPLDLVMMPTVFSLDEVVVTGSFRPQKADKSIYDIKVVGQRKIEEQGANNLKDLLTNQVNLSITQDPALGSSLKIKGLTGNNVKILVDGVPVIGRMGGNIDLTQLNLYNIDHVEMVEGPMSVIYGSDALAGAINIITKENKSSNFGLTTNAYYETAGTYNIDGNVNFRKKRHSVSLSLGRNFFDGFSTDTLRSQAWKPKEQYNGDLYYMYSHDKAKIKYQLSYMHERLWDRGNLLEPLYYKAFDSWFYSTRLNNRLDYDRSLSNGLSIKMLASYSIYTRRKVTYLKDLSTLTQELSPNASDHDTTDFNAFVYRLVLGQEDPSRSLNYSFGLDLNHETGTGKRIADNKQAIGDYALFASLKYTPWQQISFQPGLRFAYNTSFSVPPVPSLNLKWQPSGRLTVRGSYARGYRAPTIKELYIYFVDVNHNILPNPDLKPEYGHNFDISMSYNTDKEKKIHYSGIDFGVFYNNMHNIIQLALRTNIGASGAYQYVNVLNYNTLGYQATFTYEFYQHLEFALGLGQTGTYFSFAEKSSGLGDYKYSGDINTNLSWTIPAAKLRLSAFYKYTGRSWLFTIDENNKVSTGQMADYHNLDLTVLRKFLANRLAVSAGVKNVFNNTNIDITGNVSAGVHTSGDGNSPVNYGRLYFLKLSYSILK